MDFLYRYFLNLIRQGKGFSWSLARARQELTGYNPLTMLKGALTAFSSKAAARFLEANPDATLSEVTSRDHDIPIEIGRRYTEKDHLDLFSQLVRGPYNIRLIIEQTGASLSGFQTYNLRIGEGETIQDAIDRMERLIEADYGIAATESYSIRIAVVTGIPTSV